MRAWEIERGIWTMYGNLSLSCVFFPCLSDYAYIIDITQVQVRIDHDDKAECGTRNGVNDERKELQSDACPEIDSIVEKSC